MPQDFCFSKYTFFGHSLVLRFKFSLLGYCALFSFENKAYDSWDVLLRNKVWGKFSAWPKVQRLCERGFQWQVSPRITKGFKRLFAHFDQSERY